MTNEEQDKIPRQKTLYDKILEDQQKADDSKEEIADSSFAAETDAPDTTDDADTPGLSEEVVPDPPVDEPDLVDSATEAIKPDLPIIGPPDNEPDFSWAEAEDEPEAPVKKSKKEKKPKETKERTGKNNRQKRMNIMFIVLFTILFGVIAYLVYVLTTEREESEEMKVTLEMQKDKLTNELTDLYSSYDSLQTNNDSMNILIKDRQDQIRNLLAVRQSNAKKIQLYDAELTSLRDILRSYVVQVDSLHTANLLLQAENRASQSNLNQATSANKELEKNIKSLEGQVEKASVVKALFVRAEPIESNGNIARRIKRTDKIRVTFSLAENAIAKRGLKQVYIRIANPNERLLTKNAANVFTHQGKSIPYSEMREVEYEGTELEMSIFYEAGEGEIIAGTYYVDLYLDGELVNTTSFSLK